MEDTVYTITESFLQDSPMREVAKGHLLNVLDDEKISFPDKYALLFWMNVWIDVYMELLKQGGVGTSEL